MTFHPILLFRLFLCFGLCACVLDTRDVNCNFKVNIEQNLHNEGFHRNLSYTIKYGENVNDWQWNNNAGCVVGLEQILPAGVYASPDEVHNYYNDVFVSAIFKSPVDIEISANEASPITLHLLGRIKDTMTQLSLPVHARYHASVAGSGFAGNEIPPPRLYLNCQDKRLNNCEVKGTSNTNSFCRKDVSLDKCPWREIPVTMVSNTITWEVPVGNTDHYYIVASGTALATIVGSLYLLKTIHWNQISNKRINSKIK